MGKLFAVLGTVILCTACGDGSGPDTIDSVIVSSFTTTVRVGESAQFNAVARDASGAVVQPGNLTWTSSAESIATVSETGLVTGLAAGQATIRASADGESGTLAITVLANPSGVITVTMPGDVFTPFFADISVGGAVIFEFPARAHNVIFQNLAGAPADIPTVNNRNVARSFPVAGEFPYDCTLHPPMAGVVRVR